jgi:hypothetical protein
VKVAVKKLNSTQFSAEIEDEFKQEIEILHRVRFGNIINVLGKEDTDASDIYN